MPRFRLLIPTVVALATLAGMRPSQGQVLTVDDGPNEYGAAWIFDLAPDGTIDSFSAVPLPDPVSDFDAYGSGLASLGDLDGNGTPDLAVGAPGEDRAGVDRGAVWLLFRDADAGLTSRLALRPGRNLFSPPASSRSFGSCLASLGDLDGDGNLELAMNYRNTSASISPERSLWILSLRPDGSVARELEIAEGKGGFGGDLTFGSFAGGLAPLGDFDGDGVGDLAIGEPESGDGANRAGALWILLLNADGTVHGEHKISRTSGGLGNVLSANDRFGESVASLGDLDGDGVTDLAVGTPGEDDSAPFEESTGAVWILFLNADGTVKAKQKLAEGSGGFTSALDSMDSFGTSTVALGDFDGDGTPDLGVGAIGDDDAGTDAGALWVLGLHPFGTVKSELRLAGAFTGLASGDALGAELTSLGDWDADGRSDFAIGANRRDGPPTLPQYTDVQTAINAAAAGDTILIRGGDYVGLDLVTKSLTIQAANPLNVRMTGLRVSGLTASQSVRLSGLSLGHPAIGAGIHPGLELEHIDGRVWIDDCSTGPVDPTRGSPGMSVVDCSAVIMNRTEVVGGNGLTPQDVTDREPGLSLGGGSVVFAYDSLFTGASGQYTGPFPNEEGSFGGRGIWSGSTADFLFLSGCTAQGGNDHYFAGDSGGPGLHVTGQATVLDSTLRGGGSFPMAPPYLGPVEFLSGESLSMFVNNPTRSGEGTPFTFDGPAGAAVFLELSLSSGARYRPPFQGVDVLGSQRSLLSMGTLGPDGRLQRTLSLGPLPPGFGVLRLFSQSFYLAQSATGGASKVRSSTPPRAIGGGATAVSVQLGASAMIVRTDGSF